MVAENKVRTELEVWNQDTMDKIDIIRWILLSQDYALM
jgi:hypothetical protein